MVVAEPHSYGLVPAIHHGMCPPNLQHPVWREGGVLDQFPWRLEPAEIALASLLAQGILDTGRAMGMDLCRPGTEVRLFIKRGRKLLGVVQQGRDVRRDRPHRLHGGGCFLVQILPRMSAKSRFIAR